MEGNLRCLGNSEKADSSPFLFVTLMAEAVVVEKREEKKTLSLSLAFVPSRPARHSGEVQQSRNCVDKLSVRSFADDTNLFYSSDNLKQLESVMNQELKQIYNYCALNKLSINTAKTNYMLVSSSRCHPKINITGIEQKDYIKYLGVYIDKNLNWQPQIQHVNTYIHTYVY